MTPWSPQQERIFRLVFWPLFIGFAALVLWVVNNPLVYTQPKTARDYYMLAKWYDQQERFDEEERCILKSLAMDPQPFKALMMAGVLYHRQGQHVRAREWMERALAAVDTHDRFNHAALLFDLASCFVAEHDAERAWEYFVKAKDMNIPGAGVWGEQESEPTYWVVHGDRAKFDASLKAYYSSHFGWYLRKARSWRPARTLTMCDAYIQNNPGSIYLQFLYPLRVEALMRLGRTEEAAGFIHDIEGTIAHEQAIVSMKWQLFKIYSDKKDYAQALVVFDELMALSPESGVSGKLWARFRVDRAELLLKAGKEKEAADEYRKVLDSFSNGFTAYSDQVIRADMGLVGLLFIQRQYAEAYARMVLITTDMRYVVQTLFNAFIGAGFMWLLLRLGLRLFFRQRYKAVRSGPVKLWHLFLLLMGAAFLGEWGVPLVVSFNYAAGGCLAAAGIDLFLAGMLLSSALSAYLAWAMGANVYRWTNTEMGFVFPGWVWLGRWVLAGAGATVFMLIGFHYLNVWVTGGVPQARSLAELYLSKVSFNGGRSIFWTMAVIVLAVPVCEEIFFRMFFFRFLQTFMHEVWALIVVAVFFMAGHVSGDIYGGIIYAAFSMILSWLYIRSGSLYPPIMLHMMVNWVGLSVILSPHAWPKTF